ncbi:hypothetical protein RCL1_006504 [Eukaryota sp. TZLM3-RCL]
MASSEDFIDFFLELCPRFLDSENPLSLLYCPGEIAKNLKRDEITTLNSFLKRRHFAVHGVKLAGATYGKVEIVTKTLFSILEPLFTAEFEELKRTALEIPPDPLSPIRSNLTTEQKLQIVERLAKNNGNISATARDIGGLRDRKAIRSYKKKALDLRETTNRYRVKGGGRKLTDQDLEFLLKEKIDDTRQQKHVVTRELIKIWGHQLKAADVALDFSNGWLEGFLDRNDLVQRKATNKPVIDDNELVERAVKFIIAYQELQKEHQFCLDNIVNLDETAIFADGQEDSTIHHRGSRDVAIRATNLEKVRFTGILAATASGRKMRPGIIVDGDESSVTLSLCRKYIVLKNQTGRSWMTGELFIKYLQFLYPFTTSDKKLIVFDSARSHTANMVKEFFLNRPDMFFLVVPGHLTGWMQPADVVWMAPFKSALRSKINFYVANGLLELTRSGRFRAPSAELMASWMVDAWNNVSRDIVVKSFTRTFVLQDIQEDIRNTIIYRSETYGALFSLVFREHFDRFNAHNGINERAEQPNHVFEVQVELNEVSDFIFDEFFI